MPCDAVFGETVAVREVVKVVEVAARVAVQQRVLVVYVRFAAGVEAGKPLGWKFREHGVRPLEARRTHRKVRDVECALGHGGVVEAEEHEGGAVGEYVWCRIGCTPWFQPHGTPRIWTE